MFTFLTGEGGFLQEFLYGYPGLRWREDRLRLDPMLPPQLAERVPRHRPALAGTGARPRAAPGGHDRHLALRRAGDDARHARGPPRARPRRAADAADPHRRPAAGQPRPLPARAASADDASAPADAAVDGSLVTAWASGEDPATPATLTVSIAGTISRATLTWDESRPLAPYALQARVGGAWRTVATVRGTGEVDEVSFAPVAADAVRLRIPATRQAGENPRLAELAVAP